MKHIFVFALISMFLLQQADAGVSSYQQAVYKNKTPNSYVVWLTKLDTVTLIYEFHCYTCEPEPKDTVIKLPADSVFVDCYYGKYKIVGPPANYPTLMVVYPNKNGIFRYATKEQRQKYLPYKNEKMDSSVVSNNQKTKITLPILFLFMSLLFYGMSVYAVAHKDGNAVMVLRILAAVFMIIFLILMLPL